MKLRLAALAGIVTLLAVLFLLRVEDNGTFAWPNWMAPAPNRWQQVGQGSSIGLVEGPPSALNRSRGRRGRAEASGERPGFRKLVLDEELRDALGPAEPIMVRLWEGAFNGIRSFRRDPDGRLQSSVLSQQGLFPASRGAESTDKPPEAAVTRSSILTHWVETIRNVLQAGTQTPESRGSIRTLPENTAETTRRMDFDGRNAARTPGGGGLRIAFSRSADEPSASVRRSASKAVDGPGDSDKKPHVLRLSDWIGRERVEPPTGKLTAPSFTPLKDKFPTALPDGKPYSRETPEPEHFDRLIPPGEHPDYEKWLEKDEHRMIGTKPHWHVDAKGTPFYHIGSSWGRSDDGGWAWMIHSYQRWWTVADEAQRMVRYEDNWWWRTKDGWFLLRNGEPWGWRHFADWRRDGLIHPGTGTKIFYSQDGNRIVVSVPGEGSSLFDAQTGRFIYRFPDSGQRSAPSDDEIASLEGTF